MNSPLNPAQIDSLIEIINIGAGNASTALSQMVGKKVEVSIPELHFNFVEKVPSFIGSTDEIMTVVLLKMKGDAPGTMFLMFPPESALNLAGLLTNKRKASIEVLDDLDLSALNEVGNILTGACATALSNFLNINILQSVPETVSDMVGAVTSSILADFGQATDQVLTFKVNFYVNDEKIEGKLFFLFDPKSTEKILSAIVTKKNE